MSAVKQELKKVIGDLSDDESRIVLKFAEWIKDQEQFSEEELKILRRGEQQIKKGDIVFWR